MKNAVVLGSGSFGTALARLLADRGLETHLWGRNAQIIEEINSEHRNQRYLPDIPLPENFRATTDLAVTSEADLIVVALPSRHFREVLQSVQPHGIKSGAALLSTTKGIELSSGKRMTQVLADVFPDNPANVLSGPTHAEELAKCMPTAAVIGGVDDRVTLALQDIFTLPYFRSYTSQDVIGIEIGGTVKNIVAIAAGIVHGLGLGDNSQAALVTRGLAEMVRLGAMMGGDPQTFLGLSGVGDLIVTCFSDHSRNNRVGRMLGQGLTLTEVKERMNMVAEGVPNTESVYHLAQARGIRTPVTELLYGVLKEKITPEEAARDLLSRSPRPEAE